jgi:DNA polymerase III epsilon subunit-like protein
MTELIAIDTETHPLRPEGKVRSEHQVPEMVCFSYSAEHRSGLVEWNAPRAEDRLKELIGDKTVVFHNAKFDLAVLTRWAPGPLREYLMGLVDQGRVLDTMVLYALRYPVKGKSRALAAVYKHLFRKELEKGDARTSFRRGVPLTNTQRSYAIEDAVATLAVAQRLLEIPYGALARQPQEFVIAAAPDYNGDPPDVLYSSASAYLAWFLEPEGLPVNHEDVNKRYIELEREERALSIELYEAGLMRAERTPGTPTLVPGAGTADRAWTILNRDPLILHHQAGSRARGYHVETIPGKWVLNQRALRLAFREVAADHNLDVPLSVKTGKLSLEYDFWKEYSDLLPPQLQTYLRLSKVRKYRSSFVGPLHDQRPAFVYPHYLIPGAETCRWACYRPNIQNQPKKLRSMYGDQLLGADYKSLECFTLAHASPRSASGAAWASPGSTSTCATSAGCRSPTTRPARCALAGCSFSRTCRATSTCSASTTTSSAPRGARSRRGCGTWGSTPTSGGRAASIYLAVWAARSPASCPRGASCRGATSPRPPTFSSRAPGPTS